MTITGNVYTKSEIYYFSKEVEKFLEMLNGTTIQTKYKSGIEEIEYQKGKLEALVSRYSPTIYEEYSNKVKYAYKEMIESRKEYDRVVKECCFNETIDKAKKEYENKAKIYEDKKAFRNKLKEELEKI